MGLDELFFIGFIALVVVALVILAGHGLRWL